MKTLGLETAHKYLIISLMENNKVIAFHQELAWKKQSEHIFPMLESIFDQVNWKPQDVQQIVITKGPGSYTGIRIAMTIAKVLATRLHIPLYTLSTLQYYAGLKDCYVVLDARGKRVYWGYYKDGIALTDDQVSSIEDFMKIRNENILIIGDGSVLGQRDYYPSMESHFLDLESQWELVADPHFLTPEYLKEKEAYRI